MPAFTSIAMGIGAAAGVGQGIAGMFGGDSKHISETVDTVDVGDTTRLNALATQETNQLATMTNFVDQGPGAQDIQAGTKASRDLAALFGREAATGGLPGQQDIRGAQGFASQIFNPQRVALQQAMAQQSQAASRQGALMGRSANDPILRAKLASEQTRQQQMLEAQQGAFSADYANQLQQNRLNLSSQQANILGGLATQALQNRQTLLSLGNQLTQQEREWKLATATRRSRTESSKEVGPGDRAAAGIGGIMGGIAGGMQLGAGVSNMFGGGGGGGSMSRAASGGAMSGPAPQQQQPTQAFSRSPSYGIPGMGAINQGPMMRSGQFYSGGN